MAKDSGSLTRRDCLRGAALLTATALATGCSHVGVAKTGDPQPIPRSNPMYDAIIVGGGPGGLAAALTLGRARKRTLLCDAGPRRNAAATHIHNFVTRDGTPPDEFRAAGRKQLETYPNVEVRDVRVERIDGSKGAFAVTLGGSGPSSRVEARRVVLSTGMIDQMLPIDGFEELWGASIFQCPYCHGWEEREKIWGYLASPESVAHFPEMMLAWTDRVVVFTQGSVEIPEEVANVLVSTGVRIETKPIAKLESKAGKLDGVLLENGSRVPCEVLFAHPPQRQVELVRALQLELGDDGYVKVDPMTRETSAPGIYAVGDLTSRMQAAIMAASTGMHAGAVLNADLTKELIRG